LPAAVTGCYLITVRRVLALLIMFAMTVSNGAGLAAAMCQHEDVGAHAMALQSADKAVAAAAAGEEAAAAHSSETQGTLADSAPASLAGFILPSDGLTLPPRIEDPTQRYAGKFARLSGRSLRPLLKPPLA
jgi:hypothetical protein